MPKFLEDKLKREYGEQSAIPYKVMNKIGAMHGSKITAKGREMEQKHEVDMKKHNIREMRIEVHRGKDGKVTGHTVHHHLMPSKHSKSGAFMEETHHSFPFGPEQHAQMMKHVAEHLGAAKNMAEEAADEEEGEGEE